jgi:hypothetical protein
MARAKAKGTQTPAPAEETAEADVVDIPQPIPAGSTPDEVEPEAPAEETADATPQAPVDAEAPIAQPAPAREYVTLNGPASYGPVILNGQRMRARAREVYHVPNAEERADVLGTGKFRSATDVDMKRAGLSSAGIGGPITRESLPPGALKGGRR